MLEYHRKLMMKNLFFDHKIDLIDKRIHQNMFQQIHQLILFDFLQLNEIISHLIPYVQYRYILMEFHDKDINHIDSY
jgi:hypothetical protein